METFTVPPCSRGCPVGTDVRGYVDGINRREMETAARLIREHNHLASVCGWICPSPCTKDCRRGQVDEALAVRSLKRFALEAAGPRSRGAVAPDRGTAIAIVGGGPAGLTAAADLALAGYRVTVLERGSSMGGHLAASVPAYRLPPEILAADVAWIESLGVEFRYGESLGRDFTLDDLKEQGFAATILAVGLPDSRGIPGLEHGRVRLALPFLQAAKRGEQLGLGERTVVVGGGDVAADVARTARRAGSEVVMVSLERRWELPANPVEIRESEEEGVLLQPGYGPVRLELAADGRLVGLVVREVERVFDENGRFSPRFYEDRLSTVPTDDVILAIGQAADLSFADEALAQGGRLRLRSGELATERPGVFAAGEVAEGPGPAIKAMASGHRVATEVRAYLEGTPLPARERPPAIGRLVDTVAAQVPHHRRVEVASREASERLGDWLSFELGYDSAEARAEANRCLRCGWGATVDTDKCAACLNCVRVCPYGVPQWGADRLEISEACQACGLCAAQCPAGAISLGQPAWRELVAAEVFPATTILGAPGGSNPGPGEIYLPSGLGLDPLWIWRALEQGAVVVIRSAPEHHAGEWERQREVVAAVRRTLRSLGQDPDRVRWEEEVEPTASIRQAL